MRIDEAAATRHARRIAADPDALAAYETGLLDVPQNVETALDGLLARSRRDYHSADDVKLLRGGG
jgi:hypothetical protein